MGLNYKDLLIYRFFFSTHTSMFMICGWLTLWMWYPMDMEGWLRDSSTHRFWYLQGYLGRTSAPWILKDMCTKNSVNWTTETYPLTVLEVQFNSVQLLSPVWLFETPWTTACQASLSITNSWSLPKSMSTESCHPTISSSVVPFSSHLQSFPASGSFKWVSSSHQVDKVLEFQL